MSESDLIRGNGWEYDPETQRYSKAWPYDYKAWWWDSTYRPWREVLWKLREMGPVEHDDGKVGFVAGTAHAAQDRPGDGKEAEVVEDPEAVEASVSLIASPETRELASSPRRRGAAAAKATGATSRTM